jgi:predicted DNA-binding protein
MAYARTQVYLDPEDHARLVARAREQGKSMTALLREIVAAYLREGPEDGRRGFDAILGVVDGDPTDIAESSADELALAREARLRKKLGD